MYEEKLKRLIDCKTLSSEIESKVFKEFHNILKDLFPNVFSKCEIENFDGSLLIKCIGKEHNHPMMFMNHQDIVEANGNWDTDPFNATIKDNKLYGRGTLDTKGGLFCMLEAIEQLLSEGFVPNNDIYFESGCNEETSGSGANRIVTELEKRNIRFSFLLDEGGMMVNSPIPIAKGKFAMIGMGEKGCVDLKFTVHSNGGHASTPPKNSPLVVLSKFMVEVEKKNLFRIKMNDTTAEMFRVMASRSKGFVRLLLGHPRLFKPLIELIVPKLSPTTNALFRTTLAFTMAKGSEGINVLPQEAFVTGNMRFSHHQGRESSLKEVRRIADKYGIEVEVLDPGIESTVTDYRNSSYKFLCNAVNKFYKDVTPLPYICNGTDDARFFTRISNDCLRFVPFFVDDQQLSSIHGLNENVNISDLEPAVEFYKYLMKEGNFNE